MIRTWNPTPPPTWVTPIPSLRHPELVPDFAKRLAGLLGLPYLSVLTQFERHQPQKEMANSVQQGRNLDGSLIIHTGRFPREPVLLVDDMVDSRWTLTVATWLLRSKGCPKVWPLALALVLGGR